MDKILFISDFPEVQYGKDAGTPALRLIVEALQKKYELVTVKPESLPGNPIAMKWHNYRWPFMAIRQATELVEDHNFKLVYGAGCGSVAVAGELTCRYGIPSVGRLFGTYLFPYLKNPVMLGVKSEECSAFRAPCTKFVITNDGTGGDRVAEHFGIPQEKLRFWRNGVEVPPVVPRRDDRIIIISMARLEKWKHVERIINAFIEVEKENDKTELWIVGGGPEMDSLRKLAGNHRVLFFGEVKRSLALYLLAKSDIFISTNDYSNVSNSLMEAMAAGKAVIALNTGMTADTLSGNGSLVREIERLPGALYDCCASKNIREMSGLKAKNFAREYFESWESRIAREVAVCEQVMG